MPEDVTPLKAKKICYVWPLNNVGGIETMIQRHGEWHRRHGIPACLITCEGPMDLTFGTTFAPFISLASHELDLPCLDDDEFEKVIDRIADRLSGESSYHFVFFSHLGAYIASRLAARYAESSTTLYILEDRILGPHHLEFVDQMNKNGMVITMNEACVDGHRKSYGYTLDPSPQVVPLAVDHIPPQTRRPFGGKSLLTVARLYPMKDYVFGLIEAVAVLVKEQGHEQTCLTIVGDGPYLKDLRRLAETLGVSAAVRFVGTVPPEKLCDYYADADIFVGMGTTLLEASRHGVPSVVAVGHSRAFESHGFFGDLPGYGLGEASSRLPTRPGIHFLRELLSSNSLKQKVADSCLRKVADDFGSDKTMRAFLDALGASETALLGVPMPPRPERYGRVRRYLKRRLWRFKFAMKAGRLIRSYLGEADF